MIPTDTMAEFAISERRLIEAFLCNAPPLWWKAGETAAQSIIRRVELGRRRPDAYRPRRGDAMTTSQTRQLLTCGCAPNAELGQADGTFVPGCVTHMNTKMAEAPTDLSGRAARCTDCGKTVPSSQAMAFFEHHPEWPHDRHYDGCGGWD